MFEFFLPVVGTGPKYQVPEIAAPWKIANVVAVVVVVEGRPAHQRQDSHGAPREFVPWMSFCANHNFPPDPEEEGKDVRLPSKHDEAHGRRHLH